MQRITAATLRRLRRWQNWLVALALAAAVLAGCRLWPHPPLSAAFPRSTAIFDDSGHLLRLMLASDGQYRLWTPYKDFSPKLVKATLMREDQWFWWEPGFNPWGLLRGAWVTYVEHGHPQGGSTIAMQLARLMDHLHTRSPLGKLHQIALAIELELFYSKRDILTAYLNYAPYGGNVVGAGTASLVYFGKPAHDLNLPEALTLAVIPQNPSRLLTARRDHGNAVAAPDLVAARNRLYRHWLHKHSAARQWKTLFAMPLALRKPTGLPFKAPDAVQQLLATANASGDPLPPRVALSIDLPLQKLVTRQLQNYVQHRAGAGIHNAAAILVDTRTMGIKAMVGSADFFDKAISGQINGTLAERSPGSTLKPFIYGLALDQGVLTPATVLRDVPTTFGSYSPEDFDGTFRGPITATQALIQSRNIPAVRVDSQLHDPDLYGFLRESGVKGLASRQHYGLALVLGGGDVTMQDLARMYALLANGGVLRPLRLRENASQIKGKRLLSAAASFMIVHMLQQKLRPGTVFGTQPSGLPVFWKTGTSWAFHDAWTAGGFGPYVLVVWIGNFDSTPNPAFVGLRAAAPLFFRIYDAVRTANPGLHAVPKPLPKRLKRVRICLATGQLPSRWCPEQGWTWFIPGVSPIKVGTVYRPVVISDTTGKPACPPYAGKKTHTKVFQFWPSDLAAVFARAGIPVRKPPHNPNCINAGIPTGYPPHITSPLRASAYVLQLKQSGKSIIALSADADANVETLYWFVDNAYLGRSTPTGTIAWWPPHAGTYRIRVVDDHGRSDARQLTVALAE